MKLSQQNQYRIVVLLLCSWAAACGGTDMNGPDPVVVGNTSIDATTDGDFENSGDREGSSESDSAPALARLHAEGKRIVDANGNVVVLKGVNLGGWLYHETWITAVDYSFQARAWVVGRDLGMEQAVAAVLKRIGPARMSGLTAIMTEEEWIAALEAALKTDLGVERAAAFMTEYNKYLPGIYDDSDFPLFKLLETRFGADKRDELLDAFNRGWIREEDIAWLSEQGFNLVRVPIGYRALTTGSHLEKPTSLSWNEKVFDRLNDLLDWCEAHGVYAVLDIQECPGGQNDYSAPAELYTDPKMQDLTVELWRQLSDRFKSRDSVAAYSLLAEPMSAPDADARDLMYDKLVKAIRAKGDDHLLVIHDGFKNVTSFPDPAEYGWDNVIYSTHLFEWANNSEADYDQIISLYDMYFPQSQDKQNVPYFIGSFSTMIDAPWAYASARKMREWMDGHGWSWSLWTYKSIDDPISADLWGDKSGWGLRGRLNSEFDRPDIFNDDEATLLRKFEAYKGIVLDPNADLLEAVNPGP